MLHEIHIMEHGNFNHFLDNFDSKKLHPIFKLISVATITGEVWAIYDVLFECLKSVFSRQVPFLLLSVLSIFLINFFAIEIVINSLFCVDFISDSIWISCCCVCCTLLANSSASAVALLFAPKMQISYHFCT